MTAAPFLVDQLGPDARISVQVAWGADVTAAYATWAWTDITGDVRISEGIDLKHGRGDEAAFAQPSSCSLVLDNTTGAYSLGGQSPNWPFVRQNTPVRVQVDHDGDGTYTVLFIGYADSWQPTWNQAASVAEVHLTASGILRRMAQRTSPVTSALRRRLSTESNVVAYWPLEEGKLATEGASGIEGGSPMTAFGTVEFAANTDAFDATLQMPVLKNGGLVGAVPFYTGTSQQFRMLMSVPENGSGLTNTGILVRLQMQSTSLSILDVGWGTGGTLVIAGYSIVGRTETLVINTTAGTDMNGKDVRLFIELAQVGSTIEWDIGIQDATTPTGGKVSGTLAASTMGSISTVTIGAQANHNGLAVGHAVVQNEVTSIFSDYKELSAFDEEVTHTRYTRLTGENGIESVVFGDSTSFDQITDEMGTQQPEPLLTLLQQIQQVDRGIIFDGLNNGGLTFNTRRAIETRAPTLTIDVAAAELAGILTPVDDDQERLNKATVTRRDGATAVHEDVDGPLGTTEVGTYDSSLTIPVAHDAAAMQYASWAVALGTVEGYRYPSIELDLTRAPNLIPGLLALRPGHRLDLINVADVATQHPDRTVRLVVQGYEQTITPFSWTVTLNCTPYAPWQAGRTVNTDGSVVAPHTSEMSLHLDTAGSQLNAAALAGATSLSVATTSGPIWTTSAQDFPFDVEVGGIVATVTAISGASSPQTFTVTGVTKALASGLDLHLHAPLALGL